MPIKNKKFIAAFAAIAIAAPSMALAQTDTRPIEKKEAAPPPVETQGAASDKVTTGMSASTEDSTRPIEGKINKPAPVETTGSIQGQSDVETSVGTETRPVEGVEATPPPLEDDKS